MSLYRCTKCDCVENTACGEYWAQQMEAHKAGRKLEPLCSQCRTGTWHGQFERYAVPKDWLVDVRGFLWSPESAKTVPHLGPFKAVTEVVL